MVILRAKKSDNLNELFNTTCSDLLCVFLPEQTVFRQKVSIQRDNLLVVSTPGTRIVWNDHNSMVPGFGTADSATLTVKGHNVKFVGLTVENSFDYIRYRNKDDIGGGMGLQAVAVYISAEAEYVDFTDCTLLGWQDTLFADGHNCLFKNSVIKGCVDFIFGSADGLFKDCKIVSRAEGFVSAPSTKENDSLGFCFYNCEFNSENDVNPDSVFLARPWHPGGNPGVCSYIDIIHCKLSSHVSNQLWTFMKDSKGVIHTPLENRFSIDEYSIQSLKTTSVQT